MHAMVIETDSLHAEHSYRPSLSLTLSLVRSLALLTHTIHPIAIFSYDCTIVRLLLLLLFTRQAIYARIYAF